MARMDKGKKLRRSYLDQQIKLENSLQDGNLTKAQARKLQNRLSALASRQRTQSHIDHLEALVKTLQEELKQSYVRIENHEGSLSFHEKNRVKALVEQPLYPEDTTRKRARPVRGEESSKSSSTNFARNVFNKVGEFNTLEPAVF